MKRTTIAPPIVQSAFMNLSISALLRVLLITAAASCGPATFAAPVTSAQAPATTLAASAPASEVSALGKPIAIASKPIDLDQVAVGDFKVIDIKVGVGSLSPQERASFVSQRLLGLAQSQTPIEEVVMQRDGEGYKILSATDTLFVLTPADASAMQRDIDPLAGETLEKVRWAIAQYRESRSFSAIAMGAGLTVLSVAALALLMWLIRRGFHRMANAVPRFAASFNSGLRIKETPLLSVQRIEGLIHSALGVSRVLVILACLYFFLPLILSFFPLTRAIGKRIFELFLTPLQTLASSFVAYIPNFFYILVIILIAHYVLRATQFVFKLIETGDLKLDWFFQEWATPTFQIVRALLIIMAAISAFPYIPGSGSPAFQGVGLVLGLVVSFASSSAISNIVAGIILVYTRAFKLGDCIQINDTLGDVVEKTLLVTRVKTPKNVVVTVPNSLVLSTHILNYSNTPTSAAAPGLVVHTTVTIGYDVAWSTVEGLLIEAARRTQGLLSEPSPFVLQTSLDDFYVAYEINAYTTQSHQLPRLNSDLHRHIQDTFNDAGVEIMSPHYRAQRDGSASTVRPTPTLPDAPPH